MSNAEQASEPSMEDILASIRKIIAEEPDDGDAPTAATHESAVADAARFDHDRPSGEEASATETANASIIPMPGPGPGPVTMPEPITHSLQAVDGVPGPVAELPDDDSDNIGADEQAGEEIFQASRPAADAPDDDQSTADQAAKPLSAFDALLAASTAPAASGNLARPMLSAAPSDRTAASTAEAPATSTQGMDALPASGSAEGTGGSSATGDEPQLGVPLPSLNDLSLGAPASAASAAEDSVDELMSLLDAEPSPAGSELHDARVEPALPMPTPVSAFEAHVPKPAPSLGPLLSRIDPEAAAPAGAADRDLATIPGRDADAAAVGLANDAENLDDDQTLDPAKAPSSAASAIGAGAGEGEGDDDAATNNGAAEEAAAEPALSTLMQNLGAAAEPVASAQPEADAAADDDPSDHGERDAGDGDAGQGSASNIANGAGVATAAALGALAAGIAAADAKPDKVEPQSHGATTDGPAKNEPARTPSAPPPSQIASLGALLASAPGSLTAQSEFDDGVATDGAAIDGAATADDAASSVSGDDADIDAAPKAGAAAVSTGNELTQSATQPTRQQILPSAVGDLVPGSVKTMEDTVTELLRPMLRDWLDSNMPRIVEKALRVELAATIHSDTETDTDSGKD